MRGRAFSLAARRELLPLSDQLLLRRNRNRPALSGQSFFVTPCTRRTVVKGQEAKNAAHGAPTYGTERDSGDTKRDPRWMPAPAAPAPPRSSSCRPGRRAGLSWRPPFAARARLGRAAGAAPGSGDHTGSGREGRPSPPSLAGSEPAPTGARPPHGSQQAPSGGRAAAPPGTRRRSDQGRCRATAGSARGKKQHNELATREQRYLVSHVRCPFAPPLPTRGAMA